MEPRVLVVRTSLVLLVVSLAAGCSRASATKPLDGTERKVLLKLGQVARRDVYTNAYNQPAD